MADDKQPLLFEENPPWKQLWDGMPEYEQQDLTAWHSVKISFRSERDMAKFAELIGQPITSKTKFAWYPEMPIRRTTDKRWISEPVSPRYPVYIISKGRWESRLTSKALDRISVPYKIVVEPQEYDQYAAVIHPAKILTLPFSNLGQGSIPARNWVWDHAVESGAKRHWILDDNISGFTRLTRNLQVPVASGAIFQAAEDFADRYLNVSLCGFNYDFFVKSKTKKPAIILNTRIYSCILIQNDTPFRWRGRYNEDTDLALRVLKSGACTVLFNCFLALKAQTLTMAGGNTDELYEGDGRTEMAKALQEQHPDMVKITWKFNRWQHQVNYKVFRKNKLQPDPDAVIPKGLDEYGMKLVKLEDLNNGAGA